MSDLYEVVPYDIEALKKFLAASDDSSSVAINQKLHCVYFEEYFGALNAKTIIIEPNYIDRDYLEDFSAYYVRCFHKYNRICIRLHFFNIAITSDSFSDLIRGNESAKLDLDLLQKSYLGFIVVKPLPFTIVGRTCLTTYPSDNNRNFPIKRDYSANLFGINLRVTTLAFQEQDSVVAACATSALWSAFQGTGISFQHSIPSPAEITKSSAEQVLFTNRLLPNRGLTGIMMAQAIRQVGLEPLVYGSGNVSIEFKSIIYAYLKAGIPVLIGVELLDITQNPPRSIGLHAVTVTGFGIDDTSMPQPDKVGFMSYSSRLDRIYAHDDQIGPFARMKILDNPTGISRQAYALTRRGRTRKVTLETCSPFLYFY